MRKGYNFHRVAGIFVLPTGLDTRDVVMRARTSINASIHQAPLNHSFPNGYLSTFRYKLLYRMITFYPTHTHVVGSGWELYSWSSSLVHSSLVSNALMCVCLAVFTASLIYPVTQSQAKIAFILPLLYHFHYTHSTDNHIMPVSGRYLTSCDIHCQRLSSHDCIG
jgi:hypothetical protein